MKVALRLGSASMVKPAALVAILMATAVTANRRDAELAAVAPLLALGASLAPHPTRERILEHLRMLPGDHLRSIARVLGLSVSEARYHLHVLDRNELVREEKVRHRVRYYAVDPGSQADRNVLFKRHWALRDLRARVLNAVRVQGSVRPTQVAKTMGISRQLATYHLGLLTESGEIAREGPEYRAPAPPPGLDRASHADEPSMQFPR